MCIKDYIFICMYMMFLCYICFEIYVYNIYDEKKKFCGGLELL